MVGTEGEEVVAAPGRGGGLGEELERRDVVLRRAGGERREGARAVQQVVVLLVVGDDEARRLSDAFWAKRFEGPYDPHENLGMARELSRVNGQWRTSLITDPPDGKMPLSERGRKLVAEEQAMLNSTTSDSYETRKWQERCLAGPGSRQRQLPFAAPAPAAAPPPGALPHEAPSPRSCGR